MPRYFFNVMDGCSSTDDEGTELPDIYAARAMALRTGGELLRDMGAIFWNQCEWRLEVLDEDRRTLLILRVSAEDRISAGSSSGDGRA